MFARFLKFFVETICGWTIVGDIPETQKALVFVYPHTSYWDSFYSIIIAIYMKGYLLIKGENIGYLLAKIFGHTAVNRSKTLSQTETIANTITSAKGKYWLYMSPEGSCMYKPYIRSGFYYIALKANVPIICSNMNYRTREYGFSHIIHIKDESTDRIKPIEEVLGEIVKWYTDNDLLESGFYVKNINPLQLKEKTH